MKTSMMILGFSILTLSGTALAQGCNYELSAPSDYFNSSDLSRLETVMKEKGYNETEGVPGKPATVLNLAYGAPYFPVLGGRRFVEITATDYDLSCQYIAADGTRQALTCRLFGDQKKAGLFQGPGRILKGLLAKDTIPTCDEVQAAREKCESDYAKYCR
jgi:hypothetical protein